MGFFNRFHSPNINHGVQEFSATQNAVLLDVRSKQEYQSGHIPGSINVPLQTIEKILHTVKKKDTPMYVYCLSGARSSRAVSSLKQMGYHNVKNIGGISAYSGKVV